MAVCVLFPEEISLVLLVLSAASGIIKACLCGIFSGLVFLCHLQVSPFFSLRFFVMCYFRLQKKKKVLASRFTSKTNRNAFFCSIKILMIFYCKSQVPNPGLGEPLDLYIWLFSLLYHTHFNSEMSAGPQGTGLEICVSTNIPFSPNGAMQLGDISIFHHQAGCAVLNTRTEFCMEPGYPWHPDTTDTAAKMWQFNILDGPKLIDQSLWLESLLI